MNPSVAVGLKRIVPSDAEGPCLGSDKGEELAARMALLSSALGLKKAAPTGFGAVGAYVMRRFAPTVTGLHSKYERTPSGRRRFILVLKLKAAIHFYHLAFKVTKHIEQRKLRKTCIDQLVLDLQRELGDLGGRYPALVGPLGEFPELLDSICAAADEIDRKLHAFNKSIVVHRMRPSVVVSSGADRGRGALARSPAPPAYHAVRHSQSRRFPAGWWLLSSVLIGLTLWAITLWAVFT